MGKIIISQNISLDGVVQIPAGDEGLDHGDWTSRISPGDREQWAGILSAEAMAVEALLLGRRTDAWFAERWLSRSGPWADRLNSMPRYIVSSTLDEPRWPGSTVLRGDLDKEVPQLRHELTGDIVVYGSTQLARALLEHDLADELRLIVFPTVLGTGQRLLPEAGASKAMRRTGVRPVGDSLALLTYERARS